MGNNELLFTLQMDSSLIDMWKHTWFSVVIGSLIIMWLEHLFVVYLTKCELTRIVVYGIL